MALSKGYPTAEGFEAVYWKVGPSVTVDFAAMRASTRVRLFASSEARHADKSAVPIGGELGRTAQDALVLEGEELLSALAEKDLRPAFYAKLKSLPFFGDAVDC